MKRMAAQEAARAHPDAASGSILIDGFQHVFRTSGMETAGRRQQRRDAALVGFEDGDYNFAHCVISRSTSRRSSWVGAAKAERRGLMTMSHSGANSWSRTRSISRIRLFIRFRTTAFPKPRGRVKPKRGPGLSGTLRQNAVKYWPAIRFPWVYALRKSEVLRIRSRFRNCSLRGAFAWSEGAPAVCAGRKTELSGVPDGSLVAHREFMAAFGAAARQDGSPVFSAHTHQKPMGLGPFTIVRLKCTFWHLLLGPGGDPTL